MIFWRLMTVAFVICSFISFVSKHFDVAACMMTWAVFSKVSAMDCDRVAERAAIPVTDQEKP